MAKKKRVTLNRTRDLEAIDSQLDAALEQLATSSEKVNETLSQYDTQDQQHDDTIPAQTVPENEGDQTQSEDVAGAEAAG